MASSSRRQAIAVFEMWWRDGPRGDEERGLGTGREQPGHDRRSVDGDKEDLGIGMPTVRSYRALRPAVTWKNNRWEFHL